MIRKLERALAAAFLAIAAPLTAQSAATPDAAQNADALSWLSGNWRGSGTMFNRPSEATLEIRPALSGRFVEVSYRAGRFEGRAFYRPLGGERWQASWFDNRGATFGIEATLADRVLTANWGSADSERGRTVYRLLPDGRLEVTDLVIGADESPREFARHVLQKAD